MDEEDQSDSAPCVAHLLINGQPVDTETVRNVAHFRTAERARLMELRKRITTPERARMTKTLIGTVQSVVAPQEGMRIAVYWPIRGEPDLRDWMTLAHNAGASVLLPVVIAKNAPLVFRAWSPGCAMERGIWNIPVPAHKDDAVPDIVISPLLGVDAACFRLGNGGGYYDQTLERFDPIPKVIGVGFPDCTMPTILPMPWDIPMDTVILADGSVNRRS